MKLIFILLPFLIFFSCFSFREKGNDCDTQLLGYWMIINENGISCNSCPKVNFINCKKGVVIKPSSEKFYFDFEIRNDTILFSEIKSSFFNEKFYSYKIKDEGKNVILELNSNSSKYILSRSKN